MFPRTPKCVDEGRDCKHFLGWREISNSYLTPYCAAFPDGIPKEIAYGNDLHDQIKEGQAMGYIYAHK